MTEEQKRLKLALHESGHSVLRILLGGDLYYLSVYASDPHVKVRRACPIPEDERVVILAGVAAEFALMPELAAVGNFGAEDLQRAEAWSEDERSEAARRAKQLVRKYCVEIGRVADMLLGSKLIVTGDEVRAVLSRPA